MVLHLRKIKNDNTKLMISSLKFITTILHTYLAGHICAVDITKCPVVMRDYSGEHQPTTTTTINVLLLHETIVCLPS